MITTNIHQLSTQHVAGVRIDTNVETDPIFRHSPAYTITEQDIINWDAASGGVDLSSYVTKSELVAQSYITINDVVFPDYSNTYQAKGNYLTNETDPVFSASAAAGITAQDIQNWNEGAGVDLSSYVTKTELVAQSYVTSTNLPDYSNTYQAKGNYLTQETDPIFTNSPAGSITHTDIANWNAAAGTIDMGAYVTKNELVTQSYITINDVVFPDYSNTYQAKGNYLTNETDPVFSASPAAGITAQDITNWNTGASVDLSSYVTKSELSAQSYLTTETDPVFSASPAAGITAQDIQNWNAGGAVDLGSYVTYEYLSAQSYVTSNTLDNYVKSQSAEDQQIKITYGFPLDEFNQKSIELGIKSSNNNTNSSWLSMILNRQSSNSYWNQISIGAKDQSKESCIDIYPGWINVDGPEINIKAPAGVKYKDEYYCSPIASYEYVSEQLAAYVTYDYLSAQSYVTTSDLTSQAYLTSETDPVFSASPAAGITSEDIENWNAGAGVDLSSYVTYEYLSAQSYLTSVTFPDYSNTYQAKGDYVTNAALANQSYVTKNELAAQSYVTNAALSGMTYVKKSELAAQSYVTSAALSGMTYVKKSELAAQSYVTSAALSNYGYVQIKLVTQSQYIDRQDNILYVITDAPPIS